MRPWIEHYGVWEPIEAGFLRARLKPGMTLLDIGANVGYFSILGARAVGRPERSSPSSRSRQTMLCSARIPGIARVGNVEPISAGQAVSAGPLPLSVSNDNCGDLSQLPGATGRAVLAVPGVRVDEVFEADARVDLIKIDIQGADIAVR